MPGFGTVVTANHDAANWGHNIHEIKWPLSLFRLYGFGLGTDVPTTTGTNTFIPTATGLAAEDQGVSGLSASVHLPIWSSISLGVAHQDQMDLSQSLASQPYFFFHEHVVGLGQFGLRTIERGPHTQSVALFRALVNASGEERESLFVKLHNRFTPQEIYEVAVQESALFGGEVRLALAASALAECGHRSLGTLSMIAAEQSSDAEYFVYAAANLKDVPVQERVAMVSQFLNSPNVDVTARALDALEELSSESRE